MIVKIDNVGKVTIPAPVRKFLGIKSGDEIKMEIIDGKIMLSKIEKRK